MNADERIAVNAAACTACRACEIACHYHHSGTFGTSRRSLRVMFEPDDGALQIAFQATCDGCANEPGPRCVAACVPGALSLRAEA